ncbi:SPOR domain-containing protein [Ferrovum sp. PN-J185]|uniref:SPOR domain-containing protein n=1 Tax=Ferrovum sp. PN-J185 TaxID=1356306 RepID=UPI0007976C4D|nr:SPOR domain-containing protein [Ferrovum sp. PN-J185]KXW55771.1 sporulation related domain protein [Ferrovum sp. PN-J185]MCC6068531.1 SPOR domain-containing protein [Ferrovum sp. PN-J185]MDE1892156.1 SPOR domain-containing protein [Betaproteobacteria bacterium]
MAKPKEWDDIDLYRVSARRRAIGAAVIMVIVIVLLPMMLNHSQSPKLKSETNTTPQVSAAPISIANLPNTPPQSLTPPQDATLINNKQVAVNNQTASTTAPNQTPKAITPVINNKQSTFDANKKTELATVKSELNDKQITTSSQVESKAQETVQQKSVASQSNSEQEAALSSGVSPTSKAQHDNQQKTGKNKTEASSSVANNKNSNKILQLGLFSEESRAKILVKEVKHHNLHAKIEKIKIKNSDRYRVYVGPFSSNEKLHKTKKQLNDVGFASLVKDHR